MRRSGKLFERNDEMTKKLMVMLLGVLSCTMVIFAEEISAEQSHIAVEAWMKKYGAITGKTVKRIETIADPVTGAQIHVAVLRGGGFVVTAADDRPSHAFRRISSCAAVTSGS